MKQFVNLSGTLRGFWDETITQELSAAGIEIHHIPSCDSPQYRGVQSKNGKLGEWIFSRRETSYMFWGNVPLTMAQRVLQDKICGVDAVPGQWWENTPPTERAVIETRLCDYTFWLAPDGYCQAADTGQSESWKKADIRDANYKLRFMADPSLGASAYVSTYTFFSPEALSRFVEISNKERVPYKFSH